MTYNAFKFQGIWKKILAISQPIIIRATRVSLTTPQHQVTVASAEENCDAIGLAANIRIAPDHYTLPYLSRPVGHDHVHGLDRLFQSKTE
ncbi:hypothetical protein KIN20_030703 [Parelaphostrongylus tenuis]|uniref:Uncharacterized protein n=1 Tax=Parelaphostrongylus tenuis TaxID=148309 RepID=A0AAD5R481_PARTN|nr:hypothetical protein KIN20_030703 [Parelaphostrongylus tenuis]